MFLRATIAQRTRMSDRGIVLRPKGYGSRQRVKWTIWYYIFKLDAAYAQRFAAQLVIIIPSIKNSCDLSSLFGPRMTRSHIFPSSALVYTVAYQASNIT